jgi:hypothetical protein
MKTSIFAYSLSFLTIASVASAQAQTTATNFDSGYFNTNDGYESAFSVDGQPYYPNPSGWQTTDPAQPSVGGTNYGATTIVQGYDFYTLGDFSTNGNNSVLFGGYNANLATPLKLLPGVTNPSIYQNFTPAAGGIAVETATFSIDFALRRPTLQGAFTNKDSFGFTLWDSFGTSQIASFMWNGMAPWTTNSSTLYGLQWYDSAGVWQSNNVALTATNWALSMQTVYRFNVIMSNAGTFDVVMQTLEQQYDSNSLVTNYSIFATQTLISGGSLGSYLPSDFSSFSIDWELASGNTNLPGSNFMVINQASVTSTVIPEPGTWAAALALLAGGAFVARRRRAAKLA